MLTWIYKYDEGRYSHVSEKDIFGSEFPDNVDFKEWIHTQHWHILTEISGTICVMEHWDEFRFLFEMPSSAFMLIYIDHPKDLIDFLRSIGTSLTEAFNMTFRRVVPIYELDNICDDDGFIKATMMNDDVFVESHSPILTSDERIAARRRKSALKKEKANDRPTSPS